MCVCNCVCIYSAADPGGFSGLKTPPRPWRGGLRPHPVPVANITVKDNVYRPTSELVY